MYSGRTGSRSRPGANDNAGTSKEFLTGMKRSIALVVSLALGSVLSASAQTPAAAAAPAGPVKIGVIAFQVAVAQTNEGQRDFADLQKKFDPRRQQLKTQSDEIDTLTKQLQTENATLTDDQRASRARAIDEKKKQLQRDAEDAQNDFQQGMQDLYNGLASKVYDVLNDYAKQHGYTIILDFGQQQSEVLWAADSVNITKTIVDAYNVKSGVPAPPAQPSQPASSIPSAPRPTRTPSKPAAAH